MMVETQVDGKAHVPLRGNFKVYREQPKAGLRFPLHPLFMGLYDLLRNRMRTNCISRGKISGGLYIDL